MSIEQRLEALAKGPKPFIVVTRYQDGVERRMPCHSEASALNHAKGQSRKIGRKLIDRETGAQVCVVSVTIEREI